MGIGPFGAFNDFFSALSWLFVYWKFLLGAVLVYGLYLLIKTITKKRSEYDFENDYDNTKSTYNTERKADNDFNDKNENIYNDVNNNDSVDSEDKPSEENSLNDLEAMKSKYKKLKTGVLVGAIVISTVFVILLNNTVLLSKYDSVVEDKEYYLNRYRHSLYEDTIDKGQYDLMEYELEGIGFISDDGTDLYHTYNCTTYQESEKDYWVFNDEYAESEGYKPHKACH